MPPIIPPAAPTNASSSAPPTALLAPPSEPAALRVLVVDDDAVDRLVVRRALARREAPVQVEEATSAGDALRRVEADAWDCVFLDYNLPAGDGLSLLRRLRAAGNEVPVVMLTGQGDEETAVEMMKAGASDYLTKGSVTPERIVRTLEQVTRLGAARRETRRAQEALAATAERLRLATEAAAIGIWESDSDGAQLHDARTRELFGFAVGEEPTFEAAVARVHPADRGRVLAEWAAIVERPGGHFLTEYRVLPPGGAVRWVEVRGMSREVPDATGRRVVRSTGTIIDITARKEAEETITRTLAAAESARLEAERANRAKSDFLAAMSHDLRTPLNAIGGYTQLIEMGVHGEVTDGQRQALARIRRAQEHLLSLINDILHFARIEAGKLALEVAEVPLDPLLEEIGALIEPQAAARGLRFIACAPTGQMVRADRDRLAQILLNLLTNAVKFTEAGGEVAVECGGDADRASIAVRDTGRGIAPDRHDTIFDPFVQVAPRTADRAEGVGLGLAISRELARAMGGELTVRSAPGAGSTFTVTLPRA